MGLTASSQNEAHLGMQPNPLTQSSSAAAPQAGTSEHPKGRFFFYCDYVLQWWHLCNAV